MSSSRGITESDFNSHKLCISSLNNLKRPSTDISYFYISTLNEGNIFLILPFKNQLKNKIYIINLINKISFIKIKLKILQLFKRNLFLYTLGLFLSKHLYF